jgi:CRISPR-associated protein Cmr1
MRPEPKDPPALHRPEAQPLTFEVETITRLFGGGAKAKTVDERCWLRPPAAKSAIRSWWRAAVAHRYASLEALREAEGRIFGSPATFDSEGRIHGGPGFLSVRVRQLARPNPEPYAAGQGDALNVAYFAGAGMGGERAADLLPPGTKAKVEIGLEAKDGDAAEAVREGLRVWLTLGGAGARTRRGAGALALRAAATARSLGVPADVEELKAFLRRHCPHETSVTIESVFSLARRRKVLLGHPCSSGEEAQRKLLEALREARQDRPHPTSWRGPAGWGRSRWPEADAIRLHEGRGPYAHPPNPANSGKYPRAALGLPIVVHFKDHPEPADHQILATRPVEDVTFERYTSPILLRPVRIWPGKEVRYIPVAIFTECTLPQDCIPLIASNGGRVPVPDYRIQSQAAATLTRVETVFVRLGFQPI